MHLSTKFCIIDYVCLAHRCVSYSASNSINPSVFVQNYHPTDELFVHRHFFHISFYFLGKTRIFVEKKNAANKQYMLAFKHSSTFVIVCGAKEYHLNLLVKRRILGVGKSISQIMQSNRSHFGRTKVVCCQVVFRLPKCFAQFICLGQIQVVLCVV